MDVRGRGWVRGDSDIQIYDKKLKRGQPLYYPVPCVSCKVVFDLFDFQLQSL